ncbi:MAG: outer rane adhesin like protein [Bacteroidota bacterium]|nr:outer rane adhesin like protein [Bacteroidota bacterium]
MRKALLFLILVFNLACAGAQTQRGLDTAVLTPVAHNDTVTIIQPDSIILNVAANDMDSAGDSLCVTQVYGSPYFTLINCSSVKFSPPPSFTGLDSCWYVICNDSFPTFCDTGQVFVTVKPHYTPFMLEGSKWVVCNWNDCSGGGGSGNVLLPNNYFWTADDSIIQGLKYKRLITNFQWFEYECDGTTGVGPLVASGWGYGADTGILIGYLREDTIAETVYFFGVDSAHESILYHFNLSLGDTVYSNAITVRSIDSFISHNQVYRRYNFTNQPGTFSWIEGFGCTLGLFNPFGFEAIEGGPSLCCFSDYGLPVYPANQNDTCPYQSVGISEIAPKPNLSLYPNPAGNYLVVETDETALDGIIQITDATGREVFKSQIAGRTTQIQTAVLTGGIYFVKMSDNSGRFAVRKLVIE